jgi:hypothetical protein
VRFLENFILGIPYLFLKKVPYAWLALVLLWVWPPLLFSWILIAIVVTGLLMMDWQRRAWEAKLIREHHEGPGRPFIDRPKMPLRLQLRNLALLTLGSGLVAWIFQGQFELGFWQWFFLFAGFMLLYMDHRLLGATTVYILTDRGVGLRFAPGHVDYRLFLSYNEIWRAQRIQVPKEKPLRWSQVMPTRQTDEGVLLTPRNRDGFTRQINGEVLLAPSDMEAFLAHFPPHLIKLEAKHESATSQTLA